MPCDFRGVPRGIRSLLYRTVDGILGLIDTPPRIVRRDLRHFRHGVVQLRPLLRGPVAFGALANERRDLLQRILIDVASIVADQGPLHTINNSAWQKLRDAARRATGRRAQSLGGAVGHRTRGANRIPGNR